MLRSLILRAEKIHISSGRHPLPPAKREDIDYTRKLSKEKFKVDLPWDYLEFLEFRNGFWFEGLTIYAAKYANIADLTKDSLKANIIDENESWRKLSNWYCDYLFFGQSDMDLFALNLETKKYQQIDRSCGDAVATYSDFRSMMIPDLTEYIESMENK